MPPTISTNQTEGPASSFLKYILTGNDDQRDGIVVRYIRFYILRPSPERDPENEQFIGENPLEGTTLLPPEADQQSSNDALLHFVAFNILLPIVMILIAICFVLGVVLIVKSYMMAPLKQNLATAIRRRRRVGQAPDNNYIPQAELRASQRMSCSSDRKSLPPPEVLLAARERASQLMSA